MIQVDFIYLLLQSFLGHGSNVILFPLTLSHQLFSPQDRVAIQLLRTHYKATMQLQNILFPPLLSLRHIFFFPWATGLSKILLYIQESQQQNCL